VQTKNTDDYIRDYDEISSIMGFHVINHDVNHRGKAKVNLDILFSFIDCDNMQELRISLR
jgi:hypothetical protein